MMYKPAKIDNDEAPIAQEATVGFKFSNNTVLLESFLIQHKIAYTDADLEDTPVGRGYVIRKD